MKTTIASLLVLSAFSVQAFAGASLTELKCKSADGKVQLSGYVPGDFEEFELTADIKGNNGGLTMKLYSETNQKTGQTDANGRVTVIEDLPNGVYTVQAEDLKGEGMQMIRLYALPKTVKYVKGSNGAHSSSFTGKLTVSGENGGTDSTVACTTKYSI